MSPLLLCLCLASGCGSSSYLLTRDDAAAGLTPTSPPALPAQAEPANASVYVRPQRMQLDRAVPVDEARVRVRPRRPLGLLVAGSITLGIGAAVTGAGLGSLYCPPTAFCENGIAVAALLGVGSFHLLVGGIMDIAAAAKWSPETSPPRP